MLVYLAIFLNESFVVYYDQAPHLKPGVTQLKETVKLKRLSFFLFASLQTHGYESVCSMKCKQINFHGQLPSLPTSP